MTNQEAPFRYADHALRFAFEVEHHPIMNLAQTMASTRRGASRLAGLTSHDLHAQAAMIRSRVQSFPHLERHYLQAYFGFGEDRRAGVQVVTEWTIMQQPTGVYQRRAFQMIVEQYVSRFAGGINQVRRILKCRKAVALDVRKRVWLSLDSLHTRAVAVAEASFAGLGLIETEGRVVAI